MIFTSFEFVLFFLLVVGIRSLLRNFTIEKNFLLFASYVYYASWSVPCVSLIVFTSGVDYYVGLKLGKVEAPSRRKALLTISLILNLGLLGFFKYTNFLLGSAWGLAGILGWKLSPIHYEILLPVGISFFTFQSMSYTIDVYRRKMLPCTSLRDFLLFVAFFPQLVAGPIVRAATFLPQLLNRVRPSARDIEVGLVLFAIGAVKKMVFSDQVSGQVDLIFANPRSFDAPSLLIGLLGYAIQIYCDFSGYSDMAIGCARMMGYRFPDNFKMPYSAQSISEFWRRWHISLSTWLRDYLYIPLGGNRLGTRRTYFNLMLTMLLGGLWHGASWNFIIWGGIHGGALALHKLWSSRSILRFRPVGESPSRVSLFFAHMLTLGTVLLGWIFFRAQNLSAAGDYCWRLLSWANSGTRILSPQILGTFAILLAIHLIVNRDREWSEEICDRSIPVRVIAYSTLMTVLVCFGATDASPFIYFQF